MEYTANPQLSRRKGIEEACFSVGWHEAKELRETYEYMDAADIAFYNTILQKWLH